MHWFCLPRESAGDALLSRQMERVWFLETGSRWRGRGFREVALHLRILGYSRGQRVLLCVPGTQSVNKGTVEMGHRALFQG